jgi:hypothetical protein
MAAMLCHFIPLGMTENQELEGSRVSIDPLQHVGMQLNLEGKTIASNSQEIELLLFCPPN